VLARVDSASPAELDEPSDDDEATLDRAMVEATHSLVPVASSPLGKSRPRCAFLDGFSLDANVEVEAHDRAALERLLRYGLRPAFAEKRLSRLPSGKVAYRLKRPFYTGQTHVVLSPVDFLRRLAALIPPPRKNLIRYHGVFSPHARARAQVLALVPGNAGAGAASDTGADDPDRVSGPSAPEVPSAPGRPPRPSRHLWAALFKRVFAQDLLVCPACLGPRKLIAFLTHPDPILRVLEHLGLPSAIPRTAPARPPSQQHLFPAWDA
jgi:hypothetical protein